jgi:hypothetical protein
MCTVLRDGREHRNAIPLPRGEPETAISDGEHGAKIAGMLEPHYAPRFAESLWHLVVNKEMGDVQYSDVIEEFRRHSYEDSKHL